MTACVRERAGAGLLKRAVYSEGCKEGLLEDAAEEEEEEEDAAPRSARCRLT